MVKVLHKDTTLTTEKLCSINFGENNKKFCLTLRYNGANSYLFLNGTDIYKFKTKDSEVVTPLFLGNSIISVDNMRKTGLYVYDFSIDYDAIEVDDIIDIHKYLMKNWHII